MSSHQGPPPCHLTPRAKHRRSRHGCLRCKSLKTKCDQQRPGCGRCAERNLRCPGYVLSLRWASKNQLQTQVVTPPSTSPDTTNHEADDRGKNYTDTFSPLAPGGYAYHDPMRPFDLASVSESVGDRFITLSDRLDSVPFTLNENAPLCTAFNNGSGSMEQESGVSDWATPGSLPCDNSMLFDFGDDASHAFDASVPAISTTIESSSAVANTVRPPIHQEVVCRASALVEYFFKEVVSLYCAWDSSANKMRMVAEQKWQSSAALYHTIQSMAAACLTESFPHLAFTASSEHCMAMQCITGPQESVDKESRMLSIILLGPTASWHDPGNLARGTLSAARRMVEDDCRDDENAYFFGGALDYWTMLLSFMTDLGDKETSEPNSSRPSVSRATNSPHPFTGISQSIINTLSQVGALVYRHCSRKAEASFITDADLDFFRDCIKRARNLERQLLSHRSVSGLRVEDLADPGTTLDHLEKMDTAYRYTGLLQIYRVFPDLLAERYSPWSDDDVLHVPDRPIPSTKRERDAWLRSFAMHILAVLRDIPFESRTRCLQPFIMAACSSELSRSPAMEPSGPGAADDMLNRSNIELIRARDFVQSRLASYRHVLPLRKVSQVQGLVEEVWSQLDNGAENVYWLDVCLQKHLVTLPS